MNKPLYEYLIHTWGGFYNSHNKQKHGFEEGTRYFTSKEGRQTYLDRLEEEKDKLKTPDACLVYQLAEGFHVRNLPCCHRIVEWEGKQYYSYRQWNYPTSTSSLKYYMENKWYVGFNDYPLGDDFDYENNEVKVVQEWVTGAFDNIEE